MIPAALYASGLALWNDDIRITGRQVFQALLYSGIVTQSLKMLIGRSRPFVNNDPSEVELFDFDEPGGDHMYSLPSGHATAAFATSTVLARKIKNTYATIALYGLAATTGLSRMYHNKHWLSDVFIGAVIGTATGFFVTGPNEAHTNEGQTSPIRITLGLTGVQFEYKF